MKQYLPIILYCLLCISCTPNVGTRPAPDKVGETFQALVDETLRDSYGGVKGVSLAVRAPDVDVHWTGAAGFDSAKEDTTLTASQPFRIASVTKMFVAVAILRLHELGKLSIDDPIERYISPSHQHILTEGGYDLEKITLRHCLHHTSGLYDYAMASNTYIDMARKNPTKRWTRTEQLELAVQIGKPVGKAGERYKYSDTGYILLGETIEKLQDTTLGAGLRQLIGYENLGMASTWLETIEPEPAGLPDVVHRYFRRDDATYYDASLDLYGGGGLMSVTADLTAFMSGVFNGKVFDKKETLDLMVSKTTYASSYDIEEDPRYKDYRLGCWEVTLYGQKAYMHGGLWGTILIHVPAYNCTVSVNATKGWASRLAKKAVLVIKHLHENKTSSHS